MSLISDFAFFQDFDVLLCPPVLVATDSSRPSVFLVVLVDLCFSVCLFDSFFFSVCIAKFYLYRLRLIVRCVPSYCVSAFSNWFLHHAKRGLLLPLSRWLSPELRVCPVSLLSVVRVGFPDGLLVEVRSCRLRCLS